MEASEALDRAKCVRWHSYTPWRPMPVVEDGQEHGNTRRRLYRECTNCDHYEEK